ncbi:hypothetical protein B0O99DRAFT_689174 [Bisporella sp. PMI_857]|nr:hypothetical protein B0O99DRAFT_689174 [Bisporella sp. PMI_857]
MSTQPAFVDDCGRKHWDYQELLLAGAIDVGPTGVPDLENNISPLFDRERWNFNNISEAEYEALIPSLRLASNLILVAMPYIANFLPTSQIFDNIPSGEFPEVINLKPTVTGGQLRAARTELDVVAQSIRWELNYRMYSEAYPKYPAKHWLGVTRLVDTDRPWQPHTFDEILQSDQKHHENGLKRRPLVLGLAGEYATALRNSPTGSEIHTRATFMAAISLVHEIGHAIVHQDFRSAHAPDLREPYVEKDCTAELGSSLISWIFGGYHPNAERLHGSTKMDFSSHLYWEPVYTVDLKKRPLYKILYSIHMEYVEQFLKADFWQNLHPTKAGFPSRARASLRAIVANNNPNIATSRVPNFRWNKDLGRLEWKDPHFRIFGQREGDPVNGLTKEELAYEEELARPLPPQMPYEDALTFEQYRRLNALANGTYLPGHNSGELISGISYDMNLNDGMLEGDMEIATQLNDTPTTRIEVRYLFDSSPITQGKRRWEDIDGAQYERPRLRIQRGSSGDGDIPDNASIKSYVASTSLHSISFLTRLQAHQFCTDRGLEGYDQLQDGDFWLNSQLNYGNIDDAIIGIRISEFLIRIKLQELQNETHVDDHLQLLRLHHLAILPGWDISALREYLNSHGGLRSGDIHKLRADVENRMRIELQQATKRYKGDAEINKALNKIPGSDYMPQEILKTYLKERGLPSWGTRKALITRARRFQDAEAQITAGKDIPVRCEQTHRKDPSGFETYIFHTVLGQSTVEALKSALFIAGNFGPDTSMALFFEPRESEVLKDKDSLAEYEGRDWTRLRLKVSTKPQSGRGSAQGRAVDATTSSAPQLDWQARIPRYVSAPHPTAEEQWEARQNDIKNGTARQTFAELFIQTSARGKKLRAIPNVPGDGLIPGRKRGAFEMLELVEDYQEEELSAADPVDAEARKLMRERKRQRGLLSSTWTSAMGDIFYDINGSYRFKNNRPVGA